MRSDLLYPAGLQVANRFLLFTIVIRAVRTLHITSTRTADTANQVFADIAKGHYARVKFPEVTAPPPIEPLLISPAN
jgi:hypothetical protein